jgi:hypothetical protein
VTQDELAEILYLTAERAATRNSVRFGDGAGNDIRRFATQGAQRLLTLNAKLSPRDNHFVQAIDAFERLVAEMIVASSAIPGYKAAYPGVIGERTLGQAMSTLCPLFPIC